MKCHLGTFFVPTFSHEISENSKYHIFTFVKILIICENVVIVESIKAQWDGDVNDFMCENYVFVKISLRSSCLSVNQ